MIFAKVDVDLSEHPKAHRAGEAMATWSWGLCYTRKGRHDGIVHADMLKCAWVGEREAKKHAEKLIKVGLWSKNADGDFVILNYAAKNDTKADIEEKLRKDSDRKRKGRNSDSGGNPNEAVVGFPGSGSHSGSGSDLSEESSGEKLLPQQAYQKAYEAGVREGLGNGAGYAMPENQRGALHQAILAHSEKRQGEALYEWIHAAAADFAEDIRKRPDEQKYYSSFGPRGLLKWLNDRAATLEAKAAP